MKRRSLLCWLLATSAAARAEVRRGRALSFPRDHGAHPETRIEWWYATGWLGDRAAPSFGFQLTFFRSRTGLAKQAPGRFAARQLLFGHGALTDLAGQRHLHAQRIARWSGEPDSNLAGASLQDTGVQLGPWSFKREGTAYRARLPADDFSLDLLLQPTQPLLLQGDAGFSRKGPQEHQASHYYSQPQMAVSGSVVRGKQSQPVEGRAWLDHEWSDEILHPEAVGWDWIGMNLFDGSALTAFRLRRADGSALWAGGSFRAAGRAASSFEADEVIFEPGRVWKSPASQASYPVQWQVQTPAGRFSVRALMDGQELDSRGSTGAIYWEGLAELLDAQGRRAGLGYLEMTGYTTRLQIN